MLNPVEQNIRHTLDQHVKTMHRLLRQLDPKARLEYIQEMLPLLLCYGHPNVSGQQKLKERAQTPVQALTQRELDLIHDLAKKTENLYNAMNDGSYFG
jgi:hypothetical protein